MAEPCPHGNDPEGCEACYADDVAEAMIEPEPLGDALARLEAEDPEVRAAAEDYDRTVRRLLRRWRKRGGPPATSR
jgi:hypothetical protein